MNRIETTIIESFKNSPELSISELIKDTSIPRSTLKKYLSILVEKNILRAFGNGRGRYYVYVREDLSSVVYVYKSGVFVGYLSFKDGRYTFKYDKGYKGIVLEGLELDKTNHSASLFPIFENLIPERDRRDSYLDVDDNLVDILIELGNTHGDFDFLLANETYKPKVDYKSRKPWILVKDKILQKSDFFNILDFDIAIDKEILEEKGKHSSLSGYQNKIDINIDFKKGTVSQSAEALYILKPYSVEDAIYDHKNRQQMYLPYLGLNEHLFMSFAKNSYGFDVPWSGVIEGEDDFHYIVKRYDRYDGYKYEQRDFAQIMDIKSDQKYFTTSEKLFDAIASVVKSKEQRVRFLEFYLFSFVIEHADLHIKNISVINIGKNRQQLSPLYDIISNGVYRGDSDELGLPLGGKKRNISLEDFYQLASRVEISKLQTKKIAKNIIEIFIDEFPRYIQKSFNIQAFNSLEIQMKRYKSSDFSSELERFYTRRVEHFKQKGFLKELGI